MHHNKQYNYHKKRRKKNETAFSARPQKNEIKKNVFAFRFKNVFKTKKNETDFSSWVKKRNENETVPRGRKEKTKRKNVFETKSAMSIISFF